jgi:nodulation protein E
MHRVAITGMGCVTPIGNTVETFAEALFAGRTGISAFDPAFPGMLGEDPGMRFTRAARVKGFDAREHLSSGVITSTDSSAQFGIVAARQAALASGLTAAYDRAGIAIITGCACGGRAADEDANRHLYTRNARVPPTAILRTMSSSGASHIAIDLGISGQVMNIGTACASATHAIGVAFQMVRSGMALAALAGGYEAPLTFGFLRAWDSMRVVSPTACRPFSADRDGMTLGEGAAMLALEPMARAVARGATIYGEIVGFGMTADAFHITQPKPEGAAEAMRRALADAELGDVRGRVGYINAHGTGTLANDAVEAEAIRLALGEYAAGVPVSGTKSLTGHSIGATGALEAVATVLAMQEGRMPATAGVTEVDAALGLDVITGQPRAWGEGKDLAMSSSLAFGGLNAVVVFRRIDG